MRWENDRNRPQVVFTLLWLVFFFHGMSFGFWYPGLTNILNAYGLAAWVPLVFLVTPLCALVSPLVTGALADHRVSSERLFGWFSLCCAALLHAAFWALHAGWNAWWFVGLISGHALFAVPMWGTLATVSMAHLRDGEAQYPLVRVGATVGWIAGGVIASYVMHADASARAGFVGAWMRLAAGVLAFFLPFTRPLGIGGGWRSRMGLNAFVLLKHRDHLVFFVVTAVFSVPLTAFYMYSAEFLKVLGDTRPTGTMTLAQSLEILCMVVLGSLMKRYRVKVLLVWAIGFTVLRYALSAHAGVTGVLVWHAAGIALQGVGYTLYFITAQVFLDRRVEPGMRGQAQGLLSMVSSGIGPLAGAAVCGWMHATLVDGSGHGWAIFWAWLAVLCALCMAGFSWLYVGGSVGQLAGKADRRDHR